MMTTTTPPSTRLSTRWARRLAPPLAALALAGAGAAHAAPIEFRFSAEGFALPSSCGPTCLDVGTVAPADDLPGSNTPIPGSWAMFSSFTVQTTTGLFSGTWELTTQGGGNDNLSGTLSGSVQPLYGNLASARINYVVTGGEGMFSGATGVGTSAAFADLGTYGYNEVGAFSVSTPVPEPASWALMLAGAAGLGAVVRRQRKA